MAEQNTDICLLLEKEKTRQEMKKLNIQQEITKQEKERTKQEQERTMQIIEQEKIRFKCEAERTKQKEYELEILRLNTHYNTED